MPPPVHHALVTNHGIKSPTQQPVPRTNPRTNRTCSWTRQWREARVLQTLQGQQQVQEERGGQQKQIWPEYSAGSHLLHHNPRPGLLIPHLYLRDTICPLRPVLHQTIRHGDGIPCSRKSSSRPHPQRDTSRQPTGNNPASINAVRDKRSQKTVDSVSLSPAPVAKQRSVVHIWIDLQLIYIYIHIYIYIYIWTLIITVTIVAMLFCGSTHNTPCCYVFYSWLMLLCCNYSGHKTRYDRDNNIPSEPSPAPTPPTRSRVQRKRSRCQPRL